MLTFWLEKEGMLAPNVHAALAAESLVDFRNFRGRSDRVPDNAAAYVAHDFGYGAVTVNGRRGSRIFYVHVFRPLLLTWIALAVAPRGAQFAFAKAAPACETRITRLAASTPATPPNMI